MLIKNISDRIISKYRRTLSKYLFRKRFKLKISNPIISFSFDDAPCSAFTVGSKVLSKYNAAATYYVSLGILGTDSPSGPIASLNDLRRAVAEGNELGCHTYDHTHSWETKPDLFIKSVLRNRKALSELLPETTFKTLSYPICGPRPATKKMVGNLFQCCRSGGQTFNVGPTDLNMLNAYFLDYRTGVSVEEVKELINRNFRERGWLIFATHDIADKPSRYGCSINFFEEIVTHSVESGSLILPVGRAFESLNIVESAPS